jgi:dihydrodipicolinate synthase/N-acetylneuraminate lyase
MKRGDATAAGDVHERVTLAARTIVNELGPAGVKAALDVIGLRGGAPRLPLLPLSRDDTERVRQLMREAEQAVAA